MDRWSLCILSWKLGGSYDLLVTNKKQKWPSVTSQAGLERVIQLPTCSLELWLLEEIKWWNGNIQTHASMSIYELEYDRGDTLVSQEKKRAYSLNSIYSAHLSCWFYWHKGVHNILIRAFESVLMRWVHQEPIIQGEVSQKRKTNIVY